jgi:hypothetical protein
MAALTPQSMFGIDRFLALVRRRLAPAQQATLQRILISDYGDSGHSRQIGYAVAGFSVAIAALCLIPVVPPGVPVALGLFAAAAGTVAGFMRRREQAPRHVAGLTRRGLPRGLFAIGILNAVAMLVVATDPSLRLGSVLVAAAIVGLLLLAQYLSVAPLPLRGVDPGLETAVADFVRADQTWTIMTLIIALGNLGFVFSLAEALVIAQTRHTFGAMDIAFAVIRLAAAVLLLASTLTFKSATKRLRNYDPLVTALEAAPA